MSNINIKTLSLIKQTFKINLYNSDNINVGYVNFNIKNTNLFISAIYLFEKFRNQNIFKNYWPIIEKTMIDQYQQKYNESVMILNILARELDTKYNKLINKYKLFGFEIDIKKKEKIEYDNDFCYRVVPMQKLINIQK